MPQPRSHLPRAALAAAALLALPGCSRSGGLALSPPQPVRLSLTQLARESAAWRGIAQLDAVSAAAATPVAALPLPASALPPVAAGGEPLPGSPAPPLPAAAGPRAEATLAGAASRAVATVRERLRRDDARLLAQARDQSDRRVEAGVEEAREQATAQYLTSLGPLLTPAAARRVDVRVAVAALTVDAAPSTAQTAPDDHWGKLLAARQAELERLGAAQSAAEDNAVAALDAAVAAARASLRSAERLRLAAYQAQLAARSADVLARQQAALGRGRADLATVAENLAAQLDPPVAASRAALTRAGALAAASTSRAAAPPSAAAYNAVIAAPPAAATAERRRMETQALMTVRREAERAADELDYTVVDWNAARPDTTAMRAVSARIARESE